MEGPGAGISIWPGMLLVLGGIAVVVAILVLVIVFVIASQKKKGDS
jgi:hypothetical protein